MSRRSKPPNTVDRRIFLKRFAFGVAGVAGGVSSLGLLGRAAATAIPLAPVEEGVVLGAVGCKLQVSKDHEIARSAYVAYPAHCVDGAGKIWTAWTSEEDEADTVHLRLFDTDTEQWGESLEPAKGTEFGSWRCYQPQVAAGDGSVVIVWTATREGHWKVVVRTFNPTTKQWSEPVVLSAESVAACRPVLAALGPDRFVVAWEEKVHEAAPYKIRAQLVDGTGKPRLSAPATVGDASAGDCCRPSVAVHPKTGQVAVVYDRYEGHGTTDIHMALLSPSDLGALAEHQVTAHPATDLAPDAAFSPDGDLLWIGWHTNRRGEDEWDMPRWYRVVAYSVSRRQLNRPAWPPPMLNVDKRDTDQGFEFVRLATTPGGSLVVTGRPSHRFCMQVYRGGKWSSLYRFPSEGWGGRGQHARGLFDAKGRFWVARRDIGGNYLDCIEGLEAAGPAGSPKLIPVTLPAAVPNLRNVTPHFEFADAAGPGDRDGADAPRYNLYFGDLHGHTWMSDGMGDPDEIYRRARDIYHDDFCTVTDHDNFVDRKLLHAEYEEQKAIASHFNDPGKFVTLYAQEWTTARAGRPKGFGHKNIYSTSHDLPLYDHKNDRYSETGLLFAELRKRRAIAIPHHIGWTGVDWENHDPEIQPLVEICSVHGAFEHMGNEPIAHRGGVPGHFVRDGLARGLRFGICGGSDQHGLLFQHGVCWKREAYRAGLTGILATELTREALFDAMRKRRTFGTSGIKLRPHFSVAGLTIGEEGKIDKPPAVEVDVLALDAIRWLTVVRNGEEIVQYGGEGTRSRFSFTDDRLPEKQTSYYYLKVEMRDGNMAWTSPIWVTPTA